MSMVELILLDRYIQETLPGNLKTRIHENTVSKKHCGKACAGNKNEQIIEKSKNVELLTNYEL